MAEAEYDLVIFGASGFTGQFVVEEVARTIEEEADGLRWAIAGRNMHKLQAVLDVASNQTGKSVEEIPILIADVDIPESIDKMCAKTHVLLNCVGPYALYGDVVVKSCINHQTHHLDISGEPMFLESTQLYDEKAADECVYVIGACGWDSIPADFGVLFTQSQFDGDLNYIENHVKVHSGSSGMSGNQGTWDSVVNSLTSHDALTALRASLPRIQVPRFKHRMPKRSKIFHSEEVNSWCMPFMGCDRSVVIRSQAFLYKENKQRPVQFMAYSKMSLWNIILMIAALCLLATIGHFKAGRALLKKYPKFFSGGLFTKDGPSRDQINSCSFTHTMVGYGYSSVLPADEEHSDEPTQKIVTQVSGPEAGYVTTPICLVQAAYVLLSEQDKMPMGGGVFSPAAAFAETSLLQRLMKHNIKFEVLANDSWTAESRHSTT